MGEFKNWRKCVFTYAISYTNFRITRPAIKLNSLTNWKFVTYTKFPQTESCPSMKVEFFKELNQAQSSLGNFLHVPLLQELKPGQGETGS